MVIQSSQPEFWRLYKTLPEGLKTAIGSMKSVEDIDGIVDRNNITEEEKVRLFTDLISNVLVGLLPLEEFRQALVIELGLPKEQAEQVYRETFRFIFYPVQIELEQLYASLQQKQQETSTENPTTTSQSQKIPTKLSDVPLTPAQEELPLKKNQKDTPQNATDPYRESIE